MYKEFNIRVQLLSQMVTGETLRFLRIMKGIKQETLAKQLGISQPAYCKLEKKAEIGKQKWAIILKELDCKEEELKLLIQFSERVK